MTTVNVSMPKPMVDALRKKAEKSERSVSFLIRKSCENFLNGVSDTLTSGVSDTSAARKPTKKAA